MISEMKIAPLTARNVKITPLRVQNPVTTRPKNPLKLIVPLVAPQMHVASFCRSMAWCASLSDTTHEIPVRLGRSSHRSYASQSWLSNASSATMQMGMHGRNPWALSRHAVVFLGHSFGGTIDAYIHTYITYIHHITSHHITSHHIHTYMHTYIHTYHTYIHACIA